MCCGDFRRGAVAARQLWRAPRPGDGAAISCCSIIEQIIDPISSLW